MEIWLVDTYGEDARQITYNEAYDADPTWSPDGKLLAFVSNRDGRMGIWVITADGKQLRRVTDVPGGSKDPAWKH